MSNVSFAFGSVLQGDFVAGNGVYVYATVFANGAYQTTYELVDNGTVSGSLTNLPLPSTLVSGNIVVTMQETHTGAGTLPAFDPTGLAFNKVASGINAATNNYRYDTIELTAQNQSGDAADLTNIVQYGMPIELSANGQTRGFLPNVGGAPTGQTLANAMDGISPSGFQNGTWASGSTPLSSASDQRETYMGGNNGNSTSNTNSLNQSNDWNSYVQSLGQVDQHIKIANFFPGVAASGTTPAVSPYFVYYDVDYDGHVVTMTPINTANYDALLASSGVQALGSAIKMAATSGDPGYGTGNALTQNIYMQSGNITILPDPGDPGNTYTQLYAANNQYASPIKFLLSGFEAGFWGGQALSIPDAVAGNTGAAHLDLNKSWNWSALYAYDAVGTANGALANFDYSNTVTSARVDPYAEQVFKTSNAYGWSFSDFIASLGGATNPTLNLWTGSADANIAITLFGQTDVPTGYTPVTLSSMYLPATGTAAAAMAPSTGANQFIVNTMVGIPGTTQNVAPVDGTPMTFRFYSPTDPAHKADGFVELALPTAYDQTIQVTNTGGAWGLQPLGASGLTGKILLTNVPVTGDGSNGWYQIVVGAGALAKTYNFYTQQTAFSSDFTNIVSDGGSVSNVVSGSAFIAQVSLSSGGSITYAPDYWLQADPQAGPPTLPAPTAPLQKLSQALVGDHDDGVFLQLPSLQQADLAFSSDGTGHNNIGGFNIAKILIASVDHPTWNLMPVVAQSDIYGRWATVDTTQFWDGTYTAYMEQFKPGSWSLDRPVGYATIPTTFTVHLDKLPLAPTADGHSLQLAGNGSATKGNWIDLSAVSSSLPNGTLVVYATDDQGHMLARDGHTVTTSLDDAALGRIGSVASDGGGTVFFSGKQEIYLPVGQQLHFAVVAGDGSVDAHPTVNVSGSGSTLSVNVSDQFGTINLTAQVNNALDQSAVLANVQRTTDHPWVYLKQGDQVGVDLAWSADNINTLHFVRLDVNPTDPGKWRVGGVDYGNTDAFRAAVQNAWEFNATQGHSTGTSSATWTVKGADGYYAPVLVNQQGDIFIVNQSPTSTANADGHEHIRNFGANTFGFEDLSAKNGADFDYNDMVLHLWLH
jgi:hypothetical protein